METAAIPVQKQRINSIDVLRGAIMLVMALDHVRDYFSNSQIQPLDIPHTTLALFFTRWITHFCAPTFIFLSGVSAYLSLSKKASKKEASGFLLKRGLWLILLELTIIGFGWQFDIGFHTIFLQVIWVIAWSMIVLSALIYLKPQYILVFGLILIFGHNLLGGINSASFGRQGIFWMLLHEAGFYQINTRESIFLIYPLIPWIGVMAVGYVFGSLYKMDAAQRRPLFLKLGATALLFFVVLRFSNLYGDTAPWQHQAVWWRTVLSFINCQKYPPSLLFLLMTLGTSIILLSLLDHRGGAFSRFLAVYGRVPFFYYILHIYIIHSIQFIVLLIRGIPFIPSKAAGPPSLGPAGVGLPGVYLIWLAVILSLYFPCRWFMRYKQQHNYWWLSYV